MDKGQNVDKMSFTTCHVAETSGREDGAVGGTEGRDGNGEGHQPGEHPQDAGSESLKIFS